MKIQKRDGSIVRKILVGMIVDSSVCGHIATIWKPDLFSSKWASLIAGWCIKYYQKYGDAPKQSIEGMFESWATKTKDEETSGSIEKLLSSLSDEYATADESASQYIIDLAGSYFNRTGLQNLAELLQGDIDNDDLESARKRIDTYHHVEIGASADVDVLTDMEAIRQAFETIHEPIIRYPGALKAFFGTSLHRGGFVAFMGPEKRGKTWWLIDAAWRAMLQRKRVAFFEVGDMTRNEIITRLMIRASKRPLKMGEIQYPTFLEHTPGESIATVEREIREFDKPLTWRTSWKAAQSITKHKIRSNDSYLKLICTPNDTMTIGSISSIIEGWERRDWVPDVLIIDYADILAAPPGMRDEQEQVNSIWKGLRRLSQEASQPLVITATQADAKSYNSPTLDMSNFSRDKRKYGHVTGMIGINQTPEEKEDGLQRLNWLVRREEKTSEMKCVHVAGCLDIANPAIMSTF